MPGNKIVIIGGAGAMGRITVRDLIETSSSMDEIVIADFDGAKAQALAESYSEKTQGPRVSAMRMDVTRELETADALKGAFAVINCVQYQMNLSVMKSALI